jgi:hypothetical protein
MEGKKKTPLPCFTKSAPIAVLGWDFGDWGFVFFRGVGGGVWLIISSGSNDPLEESQNLFVFFFLISSIAANCLIIFLGSKKTFH